MMRPTKQWCLYLLECRNGAYYAGITNDFDRPLQGPPCEVPSLRSWD